jgi:hypothetical protein
MDGRERRIGPDPVRRGCLERRAVSTSLALVSCPPGMKKAVKTDNPFNVGVKVKNYTNALGLLTVPGISIIIKKLSTKFHGCAKAPLVLVSVLSAAALQMLKFSSSAIIKRQPWLSPDSTNLKIKF